MKRLHVLLFILLVTLGIFLWLTIENRSIEHDIQNAFENNWLVEKYGPKLYSQNNEELIIRDFFDDRKNGYFVDVGASHYKVHSTTYYLEKHLGWRGIAIDAISDYEKGYLENRENTHFYSFFVSDKSDKEIDFYINKRNKRLSKEKVSSAREKYKFKKVKFPTITLNDLLARESVSRIDFLSMDIELAEPAALAGFDIKKYEPSLVCIEAHPEVLEQILDYFSKSNYRVIEKYRELDPLNLYFTPKK